jgi:predicted HTH transcriptional regulator
LLVSGEINALEYAKGLISLKIQNPETLNYILAGMAKVQAFLNVFDEKPHQERQAAAMIVEGEGAFIEFKSTLRWDIRAGKTNPAIERSCLKTISAFLNSTGGNLLIGVRDDGAIEGIETDKFVNEDKFLLHLWTLIRLCLGRDFSPYISTRLEKADGKTICIVDCRPSNRPVFLRQPGFDEEMYIRLGPSSNALNISEAMTYIANHFNS